MRERLSKYLKLLFLAIPPCLSFMLLGGAYNNISANRIIISVSTLVTLAGLTYLYLSRKRFFFPLFGIFFLILIGAGLIQLIPLPASILKWVSPHHAFFLSLSNITSHPLTLAVPDTLYSIARIATLLLYLILVQNIIETGQKQWKYIAVSIIIFIGISGVFLGFFIQFSGISEWAGSQLPRTAIMFTPPFVNLNHAAAYFGIAALLSLILAIRLTEIKKRVLFSSCYFVNLIGVFGTLSRGGIIAIICVSLLIFILQFLRKYRISIALPALFLSLAFGLLFYYSYTYIFHEFNFGEQGYFSKLDTYSLVKSYIHDFWLTGSGLGSFGKVYTFYQTNPEIYFTHLENEPLQFILEFGIPFSFLFTIFAGILFLYRRFRNIEFLAYGTVLVFIFLQNLVDFNLHDFSVLFPVAIISTLMCRSFKITSANIKKLLFSGFYLTGILLVVFSFYGRSLDALSHGDDLPYSTMVYDFPADYTVPMLKGITLLNSPSKKEILQAGPYLSEAAAKAPKYYFPTYLMGKYLLDLGQPKSAIPLFRKAVVQAGDQAVSPALRIYRDLARTKNEKLVISAIPFGDSAWNKNLTSLVNEVARRNPELAKQMAKENETDYFAVIGNLYLQEKDYTRLRALLDDVAPLLPSLPSASQAQYHILAGKYAAHDGNLSAALEEYKKGATKSDTFLDWLLYANLALTLKKTTFNDMDVLLFEKAQFTRTWLGYYYEWKAHYLWQMGKLQDSLKYAKKAALVSGNYFPVAQRYAEQGMYTQAIEELTTMLQQSSPSEHRRIMSIIEEYRKKEAARKEQVLRNNLLDTDEPK